MSLLKSNSVQIGQSTTGTNNFTLSVPSSPDGTIKLARGNSGATTQDILTVNSSGAVTLTNGGAITLATAQASTSGAAINFTGIPSWVKKITVMFDGVSTNGTSTPEIRIGSGSIESSGYLGSAQNIDNLAISNSVNHSTGFRLCGSTGAGVVFYGNSVITHMGSNIFTFANQLARTDIAAQFSSSGRKTISGTLDRIQVTTFNGTDTFNAGTINIMYEG
jgi:hypothetical protein